MANFRTIWTFIRQFRRLLLKVDQRVPVISMMDKALPIESLGSVVIERIPFLNS